MRRLRTIRAAAGSGSLAALVAGLAVALFVPVALAVDSSSQTGEPNLGPVRPVAQAADAATLELYALETQLARARADSAALASRRHELAAEQASARRRLAIVRRAVRVSQRQLEELVRELYAREATDPMAVILGASSLDSALEGLESLDRVAAENLLLAERARASLARLERLTAELASRSASLAALAAEAEARARDLERRVVERSRFLAEARARAGVAARELAKVEGEARAAQRRTAAIEAATASAEERVRGVPEPTASIAGVRSLRVEVVAYSNPGQTASGLPVGPGVVAVDPSVIPLGSRLFVPGYGDAVAADTGSGVRGAMIDVWLPTVEEARAWGRRSVVVTIR